MCGNRSHASRISGHEIRQQEQMFLDASAYYEVRTRLTRLEVQRPIVEKPARPQRTIVRVVGAVRILQTEPTALDRLRNAGGRSPVDGGDGDGGGQRQRRRRRIDGAQDVTVTQAQPRQRR